MLYFGPYLSVEVIHQGFSGELHRATSSKPPARKHFIVKTYQPGPIAHSEAHAASGIESFLAAALVQKSASADSVAGKYWAPILSEGRYSDGGYYVTHEYDDTLDRIIAASVHFTNEAIRHVLSSACRGLLALKRTGHRAHGNLKPSNILVSGRGNLLRCRIVLADPATSYRAAYISEVEDLAQLGRILGQMLECTGAGHGGKDQSPLTNKQLAQWQQLQKWMEGSDDSQGPATLERLLERVPKARRPIPPWVKMSTAAIVLIALTVAGCFGYSWWSQYQRDWEKLCAIYNYLLRPLDNLDNNDDLKDSNDPRLATLRKLRQDPNWQKYDPWLIAQLDYESDWHWEIYKYPFSHPRVILRWRETRKSLEWIGQHEDDLKRDLGIQDNWAALIKQQREDEPVAMGARSMAGLQFWLFKSLGLLGDENPGTLATDLENAAASMERMLPNTAKHLRDTAQELRNNKNDRSNNSGIARTFLKGRDAPLNLWNDLNSKIRDIKTKTEISDGERKGGNIDPLLGRLIDWSLNAEIAEGKAENVKQDWVAQITENLSKRNQEVEKANGFIHSAEWVKVDRKALADALAVNDLLRRPAYDEGDVDKWIKNAKEDQYSVQSSMLKLIDASEKAIPNAAARLKEMIRIQTQANEKAWLVQKYNSAFDRLNNNLSDLRRIQSDNSWLRLEEIRKDWFRAWLQDSFRIPVYSWSSLSEIRKSFDPEGLASVIDELSTNIQRDIGQFKPTPDQGRRIESLLENAFTDPLVKTRWNAIGMDANTASAPATSYEATQRIDHLSKAKALLDNIDQFMKGLEIATQVQQPSGLIPDWAPGAAKALSEKLLKDSKAGAGKVLELVTFSEETSVKTAADKFAAIKSDTDTKKQDGTTLLQSLVDAQKRYEDGDFGGIQPQILEWQKNQDLTYLSKDPQVGNKLTPALFSPLEEYQRIKDSTDVESLKTQAQQGASVQLRLAAWQRLKKSPPDVWLTKPGELQAEKDIQTKLSDAMANGSPGLISRAPQRSDWTNAWKQFVGNATADEMFAEALSPNLNAQQEGFPGLSPSAQFNLSLYGLQKQMKEETTLDSKDQELVQAFVKMGRQVVPLNALPQRNLFNTLDDIKPAPNAGNLALTGPAVANPKWIWDSNSNRDLPVYTSPNGMKLTFRRVRPADGHETYLCTTEMSVGVFAMLYKSITDLSLADPERGRALCGWTVDTYGTFNVRLSWAYPFGKSPPSDMEKQAVDSSYSIKPDSQHPMQFVSPSVAAYAAAQLGCRLPTTDEWRAAREINASAASQVDNNNLRDDAFNKLLATVKNNIRTLNLGANDYAPDNEMYEKYYPSGPVAKNSDDGTALFSKVDSQPNVPFQNLIGNVAEFVVDDSSDKLDKWPKGQPSSQTIKMFINTKIREEKLEVIGGSAFSKSADPATPVKLSPNTQIPLADLPDKAYSDVGFRLAFSAPGKTYRQKVIEALPSHLPYLLRGKNSDLAHPENRLPQTSGPAKQGPEQRTLFIGNANRVVYICDASGSMISVFSRVKDELHKAVDTLMPIQAFNVIFVSDAVSTLNSELVMATPENKRKTFDALDKMSAAGTTDPLPAIRMAFEQKPELIYILTDGFDQVVSFDTVVNEFRKLNPDKKVKVNTILIRGRVDQDLEKVMRIIASENGGICKIIDRQDM